MNKNTTVSYILSAEIILTKTCRQSCGHCSFRQTDDPILSIREVTNEVARIASCQATQIVFIAGDCPQEYPHITIALNKMGFSSYYQYLAAVCKITLDYNVMPVLNVGTPNINLIKALEEVPVTFRFDTVSALLTKPGECFEFARQRNPNSDKAVIRLLHEMKAPYSLGFLAGVGETAEDRAKHVEEIGKLCSADPYLQDIRVVYFQPEPTCPMKHRPPLGFEQTKEMFVTLKKAFPVHNISIQPYLFSRYPELVEHGLNDLGAVPMLSGSLERPSFSVDNYETMKTKLLQINTHLLEREPLTTNAAINRPELQDIYPIVVERIKRRNNAPISLIDNDYCFVCGKRNPISLDIPVKKSIERNTCSFTWTPGPHYQGYAGVLHGGIISTLVDEAMAYAIMGEDLCRLIVTADIKVKFLKPVPIGLPITVAASVTNNKRNHIFAHSSVISQEGTVLATAEGHFVELINKV
jgi:7,8-didemethyl-8-hydroxy-5-deazariboflavin synthase CofG subunit